MARHLGASPATMDVGDVRGILLHDDGLAVRTMAAERERSEWVRDAASVRFGPVVRADGRAPGQVSIARTS